MGTWRDAWGRYRRNEGERCIEFEDKGSMVLLSRSRTVTAAAYLDRLAPTHVDGIARFAN